MRQECYCLHAHMDEMKTHSTKAKQNIRKWVSVGNRLGPGLKSTTKTWLKLKTFVARAKRLVFLRAGACARLDRSEKRSSFCDDDDYTFYFRARKEIFFFSSLWIRETARSLNWKLRERTSSSHRDALVSDEKQIWEKRFNFVLDGCSRHCSFPLNNIRIRVLRKYFLMNASFDVSFKLLFA